MKNKKELADLRTDFRALSEQMWALQDAFRLRFPEEEPGKIEIANYGDPAKGKTVLIDFENANCTPGNQDNKPKVGRGKAYAAPVGTPVPNGEKPEIAPGWRQIGDIPDALKAPNFPANEFDKWNQTFWWKSNDGWIAVDELPDQHLENVVLMIVESPHKFTARIRRELTEIFLQKQPNNNGHLLQLLASSMDLIWLDNHPYEFMTSTPLYKRLKERHNAF